MTAPMLPRHHGKVALVTGSGQGVGRGVARALAKDGARVALIGRTEAKLEETANLIAEIGGHASTVVCDITDPDQVIGTVDRVVGDLGRLDILINNAQDFPRAPLIDTTDEVLSRIFDSGPFAALRFMRAAYPHLKATGAGVIVNMGSGAQLMHEPKNFGAYVSAKWAMLGFTRTAGVEWGPEGIRALLVMPAAWTPMSEEGRRRDPEMMERLVATIPMGRMGDAELDIGRPVSWLCSEEAGYLTATTVMLDGGQMFIH
jgi:NAD(P)-dependent dehydrogenase (short-subunit alcohol dehydrogenase family)